MRYTTKDTLPVKYEIALGNIKFHGVCNVQFNATAETDGDELKVTNLDVYMLENAECYTDDKEADDLQYEIVEEALEGNKDFEETLFETVENSTDVVWEKDEIDYASERAFEYHKEAVDYGF